MFDYLHRQLALSKGAAFYRMTAARLIHEHPQVVEPLRDGRLCLTSVVSLSKALTAGTVEDVLPRFFGLSTREAKAVTAELVPEANVPRRMIVTKVPSSPAALAVTATDAPSAAHPNRSGDDCAAAHPTCVSSDPGQLVGQANRPETSTPPRPSTPVLVEEPMTAELSRIHVTVPRRLMKKLDAARAALSHSHPGASEDQVLELGLDLILERHAKRRGLVKNPRPPKATPDRRPSVSATQDCTAPAERDRSPARKREPIPAHVKRAVWLRDGGRCQWPVEAGGVCGSTLRVEIDHVVPVALGEPSTVENCRLACDFHNDLAARQVFGGVHMDQLARRRSPPEPLPPGA